MNMNKRIDLPKLCEVEIGGNSFRNTSSITFSSNY